MTILGLRLPAFCLFFIGFPLLWLVWIGVWAVSPGPVSAVESEDIVIPVHARVSEIGRLLSTRKIISENNYFSVLTMLTGSAKKLRAGEYRLKTGQSPLAIIEILKKGKVLYRQVTLPEGVSTAEIADILEVDGWIDREQFWSLANDPELLADFGIHGSSVEGYLFPDTYNFSKGQQDEKGIIRMMVNRHFQVYQELQQGMVANQHNLTHHEIITLAAIVEKETYLAKERPLVASVFLNRLEKNMRLQADPTVRYGNTGINGPLRKSELKRKTPYNTYIITGLPPGPISNPGEAAIQAVMFPARTDFLYFVSKNNGSHHFSRTLKEHNRAVARYRDGK
jgi:UPF0755 protein